jgi:hypothetical protein
METVPVPRPGFRPLGEDHDLCVLREVVEKKLEEAEVDRELLCALIDERRGALRVEARQLGEKVFEESGREFVSRIEGYCRACRAGGALMRLACSCACG